MGSPARDKRLLFDEVPEVYDRARPTYPDVLFERLFDLLPNAPEILEVGPGTGQATQGLIERGAKVTAVEIGSNLASALESKYRDHGSITVLNAPFESVPVRAASFDAVVSASAYHWVDPAQRLSRPHQLLRSGGVLAIIELIQVGSRSDNGYFDQVQPIYASFGDTSHIWDLPDYDSAMPSILDHLRDSELFDSCEVHRQHWDQTYTSEQYRELLLTYSGTRAMPIDKRSELLDALIAVVDDQFGGIVTRPLVATLTVACAR